MRDSTTAALCGYGKVLKMNDTTNPTNPTLKSFQDLPRQKRSLLELAAKARQQHEEGTIIAGNALQGETLTEADRVYMENFINNPTTSPAERDEVVLALRDMEEAREMTFTDAIVRAAFFRGRIAALAAEESPLPEMVLATMFSAQATRMRTKQGIQKTIPILAVWNSWRDAQRHDKHPIVQPASQRKRARNGHGREFFAARGQNFLVPASIIDREAFEQLKGLLKRMPAVLAAWLPSSETGLHQATWFALHFLPGAQMLDTTWFKRMFEDKDGTLKRRDNGGKTYLRFDLSPNEILVVEESEDSRAVVDALKAMVSTSHDTGAAKL